MFLNCRSATYEAYLQFNEGELLQTAHTSIRRETHVCAISATSSTYQFSSHCGFLIKWLYKFSKITVVKIFDTVIWKYVTFQLNSEW